MGNKLPTISCYNSDDDYYANFDDDYNVNDNNDYDDGNNGVNHQTSEEDLTLEEYFRSLPPLAFTEYVDEELNNSSKNQSSTNNPDWQAEKWDNPFDLNAAELGLGLGGIANDVANLANKRSTPNTVDSTLQNALTCRKPECAYHIDNAKIEGSLTEAQANALKKAAMGKADDAAGAGKSGHIWSKGKEASSVDNAYGHWTKHGSDFPQYQNAKQYAQGANDFVKNPPAGTLTKTKNGDTMYYHPQSNTYVVTNSKGEVKTMFKPSRGKAYFDGK